MVRAAATAIAIAIFLVTMTFAMSATFTFMTFFTTLAFIAIVTTAAAMMFKRLEIIFGSFANCNDFNCKVEILASKFMVCIDNGRLFTNRLDANRHRATRSLRIEHHANFNIFNALENVQRNFLSHFFFIFAVTFCRNHNNVKLIAYIVTDHSLFKSRNDHVHSLNVLERFTTLRRINHSTFVGFESVMHLDDCFFSNFHKYPLKSRVNPRLNFVAKCRKNSWQFAKRSWQ